MASTDLRRTPASAGNRKTFTISTWVKRGNLGGTQTIIDARIDSNDNCAIYLDPSNVLVAKLKISSGTQNTNLTTNRVIRDTSAWYHIVLSVDTTQSTESDRAKLYVNGVQETSFSNATYLTQNSDTTFNNTNEHQVGGRVNDSTQNLDGSLAHFHLIDGTAYDADTFGETDATTGIWKPKTAPSVTYGTNGFFLKFASAGSLGTDSSGNGNNFTLNGSGTQTQDTPSNVFATWNPLNVVDASGRTLSNGNTTVNEADNTNPTSVGTLGFSSGKWYYEIKIDSSSGSDTSDNKLGHFGWYNIEATTEDLEAHGLFLMADTRVRGQGTTTGSTSSVIFSVGDIVQCALDLDNGNAYFGKNGNWYDGSGNFDQTFANSTAVFTSITTNNMWTAGRSKGSTANNVSTLSANFGNGYFGTTAVSSAQSPSDGIGLFEYSVPSGYKALCTKSINSQEYS